MRILLMLILSFIFGVTAYALYPIHLFIAFGFGIMAILFFYSAFRPISPPPTLPEFCLYLGVFGGGRGGLGVWQES